MDEQLRAMLRDPDVSELTKLRTAMRSGVKIKISMATVAECESLNILPHANWRDKTVNSGLRRTGGAYNPTARPMSAALEPESRFTTFGCNQTCKHTSRKAAKNCFRRFVYCERKRRLWIQSKSSAQGSKPDC